MTIQKSLSGDVAISAQGLTRRFKDSVAVDHLDLQVRRGEIFGFLGPNGAGKTTTVRMLCTLLAPSEGTGVVAGYDIVSERHQVRLRIGAALQEVALDPRQTGEQLLRLQGRLYGLSRDQVGRRLTELAALIELGDALRQPISTYSGGMRRRLDLAAALIHNPEVLFLDEPTTGLDPMSRNRVWEEVRRINAELRTTILLTTQYLEEADVLADRVGIIDGGRLVAEGRPDDLKRTVGDDIIVADVQGRVDGAKAALVGVAGVRGVDVVGTEVLIATDDGSATIGPVAIALDKHQLPLQYLQLRTPTLDDVFLDLTGSRIRTDSSEPPDSGNRGGSRPDSLHHERSS